MNELNSLENQLRGLKPRRPSPKIKRRLFAPATGWHRELALAFRWLAPVAACGLVALAVVHRETGISAGALAQEARFAGGSSNRILVAYVPGGSSQSERNILANTFEWTNRGDSTSFTPFAPLKK